MKLIFVCPNDGISLYTMYLRFYCVRKSTCISGHLHVAHVLRLFIAWGWYTNKVN